MKKLLEIRDSLVENNDVKAALKELKSFVKKEDCSHYDKIDVLFREKEIQEWNEFVYWRNKIDKSKASKNENSKIILRNNAAGIMMIKVFEGERGVVNANAMMKALKENFDEVEFKLIKKEAFDLHEEILLSSMTYDKKESYLSEEEHISAMISYYQEKAKDSIYEKELIALIEKTKMTIEEKK